LTQPTSITKNQKITVKAVVAYAAKLRDDADREELSDPYASPFRPSEAAARRMSARLGPDSALDNLRRRAAMHKRDVREYAEVAAKSMNVHKARQRKYREARNKRRDHLTAGARIDGAIARLALIAAPSSSSLGQTVSGGTPDHSPQFCIDSAEKARRIAMNAVQVIEDLEDELRVRDVSQAA
jgi:hypothetical protein